MCIRDSADDVRSDLSNYQYTDVGTLPVLKHVCINPGCRQIVLTENNLKKLENRTIERLWLWRYGEFNYSRRVQIDYVVRRVSDV